MMSPAVVKGLLRWAVLGSAVAVCGPTPGRAAEAEDMSDGPARFHDVKGWRGTLVASAQAEPGAIARFNSQVRTGNVRTRSIFNFNTLMEVEFVLDDYESDPSVWRGRVTGSRYESSYRYFLKDGSIPGNHRWWDGHSEIERVFQANGRLDFSSDPKVELQFHRQRGWSLRLASGRVLTEVRTHYSSYTPPSSEQDPRTDGYLPKDDPRHQPGGHTSRRESSNAHALGMGSTGTLPYPNQGYILFARGQKKTTTFPLIGAAEPKPSAVWDYVIYLEPTSLEELRLEIEGPAAYGTWRPDAKPDGGLGTALEVRATVMTAKGDKPKVNVERFVWELEGTSTEPGIAMNFPLHPPDFLYDMVLEAPGPMSVVENAEQQVTRVMREGFSDTVIVRPRDWGGWSTLQVTAVMTDGRRVTGKLKGKNERGLLLPKRTGNSKIADSWKVRNGSGADERDDESEPVGDGNKGDGFTLYEEYRGFVVQGQHIEGEPTKKDFFVLNLIGSDAEPGIALFEALSGFRVHRVDREEMSQTSRRMNGNSLQGPQNELQHGVVLDLGKSAAELAGKPEKEFGAMTYGTDDADKSKAFRPGTTKIIGILPPGHAESLFSKPGNLSAADGSVTFFRAIAHELMHSVGAEEHGMGDGSVTFNYVGPKHRDNKVGRPYFAIEGDTATPVELRNERGEDMAALVYPRYTAVRQQWAAAMSSIYLGNPGEPGYPKMSQGDFDLYIDHNVGLGFALTGEVGVEHGQHSGNQDCIMRYHFASFYPFTGRRDAFYLITPGSEKIGFELCRSPAGTGVNAPGNTPQSRHGDATPGAGNCVAQICPNDAAPLRKSAFPPK